MGRSTIFPTVISGGLVTTGAALPSVAPSSDNTSPIEIASPYNPSRILGSTFAFQSEIVYSNNQDVGLVIWNKPGLRSTMALGGVMKAILSVACSLLVAGCAIRPLPENVTGLTTYDIVRQIRCETRQAVFRTFIKGLLGNSIFDDAAKSVAERFRIDPDSMHQLNPTLFKGYARQFVDYFWNTGVAYNFSLDMTEINNLDTEINLLQSLATSSRMFGFKAGVDRQRENTRVFTITDQFGNLLNIKPRNYCEGQIADPNAMYPMAGRIGIEPFVQEFANLALFTNLGNKDKDDGPPTMVDTLQFQTTISGSAIPKVTFSPVGTGFHVADAALTAEASRKDIHTLTMGLSVAPPPANESAPRGNALFGRLLTAKGGGTRQTAAQAVDNELTKQALSKTTVIVRP